MLTLKIFYIENIVKGLTPSVSWEKFLKLSFFLEFFLKGGNCLPEVEFIPWVLSLSFFGGRCLKKACLALSSGRFYGEGDNPWYEYPKVIPIPNNYLYKPVWQGQPMVGLAVEASSKWMCLPPSRIPAHSVGSWRVGQLPSTPHSWWTTPGQSRNQSGSMSSTN